MKKIIQFSIEQRWIIVFIVLAMSAYGVYQFKHLNIDAVPDITNVQVQISTTAEGFTPQEVEKFVTFPVETSIAGLPKLDYTRSISRYGFSQVTVIFKEKTDIYFARQLIAERLSAIRDDLPKGVRPRLGPISTGLGEIYMYALEAEKKSDSKETKFTPTDLRVLQDWTIRPQLINIEGVNEVDSIGGYEKQFHVTPEPEKLLAYGVALHDIVEALAENNQNIGVGYIEKNGEQYLVRAPGQVKTLEDIANIIVKNKSGVPIRIKDVASVKLGKELRSGSASMAGKETVIGTTMMLIGANSREVAERVDKKVNEIKPSLPDGVSIKTLYDRTKLVDATIATVEENLFLGALLVIVVLFLLLGNFRAALITSMVIPLSMLFTIIGMVENEISGNLMSLGALDFGIIIDGSVIIVENCIRRLAEEQKKLGRLLNLKERLAVVMSATIQVRRATMFGEIIIAIVYVPIFSLTGVEGKMFHPMAITVIMALLGATILSVTFIPAAVAIFVKGKVKEKENLFIGGAKGVYAKLLRIALANRFLVILIAGCIFLLTCIIATRMGSIFIPKLDEGDIAMHAMRIPSTSLTQSVKMQLEVEKRLLDKNDFPEIKTVFSKTGTAEISTDPMPPNVSDTFIIFKDKENWPSPKRSKEEILAKIQSAMGELVGNNYEYTQPIEMRFNELISGVRSDLGIKIFGDDMETLLKTGNKVALLVKNVHGAQDVKVEQINGLPMLSVEIDRTALSRFGINVAEVQETIAIAIAGKKAGLVYDGDKRFDLLVRFPENLRGDIEAIKRIPIPLPDYFSSSSSSDKVFTSSKLKSKDDDKKTAFIPLESVAEIKTITGPNQISRENGKRRIVVTANVRERDLGSFVEEVREEITNAKIIPPEYWVDYGGQFEQMISAKNRLMLVVPFALLLIFILLFATFGNYKDAVLVFTGVPFALTGGVFTLWLRGMPFSISAGVGFIALSGIAVLNGLVMITFINSLIEDGKDINLAIFDGAILRLRPVLMTALVASLGFVPMAISHNIGAEVQRPLATVVIGGILSSTILTLFVLPVFCSFKKAVRFS